MTSENYITTKTEMTTDGLYKYSPSTRQVTKLTSFMEGDLYIEYEISSDSKWAFVSLRATEEKGWGEHGENNWLYGISPHQFSRMTQF